MHEIKAELEEIQGLIEQGLKKVDLPAKKVELGVLEEEMQSPGFWDDKEKAH